MEKGNYTIDEIKILLKKIHAKKYKKKVSFNVWISILSPLKLRTTEQIYLIILKKKILLLVLLIIQFMDYQMI